MALLNFFSNKKPHDFDDIDSHGGVNDGTEIPSGSPDGSIYGNVKFSVLKLWNFLKTKLVQSDWNQVDAGEIDFIKNKPTNLSQFVDDLGHIENVQANWTEVNPAAESFILNKPTIPTVPTNLSEFIDDLGHIENVQADWAEASPSAESYINNKPTIPTVPTNLSSFVDDLGHVENVQANWSEANPSAESYIQNKPTIPTLPTMVAERIHYGNYLQSSNLAFESAPARLRLADVNGNVLIGANSGLSLSGSNNVYMATSAGSGSSGTGNIGIGANAANTLNGNTSVAIGSDSLKNATATNSTAIGGSALENSNGNYNVGIGGVAMKTFAGENAVGVGRLAGDGGSGDRSIGIGYQAFRNGNGVDNVGIGYNAAFGIIGTHNVAVGRDALAGTLTGSTNVAIGRNAGNGVSSSNKLYIHSGSSVGVDSLVHGDFLTRFLRCNGTFQIKTRSTITSATKVVTIQSDEVKEILVSNLGISYNNLTDKPPIKPICLISLSTVVNLGNISTIVGLAGVLRNDNSFCTVNTGTEEVTPTQAGHLKFTFTLKLARGAGASIQSEYFFEVEQNAVSLGKGSAYLEDSTNMISCVFHMNISSLAHPLKFRCAPISAVDADIVFGYLEIELMQETA